MAYVDGFILAIPKDRIDEYRAMSEACCAVWLELGATGYVECLADDVPYGTLTSFPRAVMATEDEVCVFSWIRYESREQRDAVNAKAITDPRLEAYNTPGKIPFDGKRMIYGGFIPFLDR